MNTPLPSPELILSTYSVEEYFWPDATYGDLTDAEIREKARGLTRGRRTYGDVTVRKMRLGYQNGRATHAQF